MSSCNLLYLLYLLLSKVRFDEGELLVVLVLRHAPALPVGAQLSPTALAQCKNVAEHEGWVHIDEVEYKGCGKSAIEVRKLIRFWLVSGEGKLQWFQEGQVGLTMLQFTSS